MSTGPWHTVVVLTHGYAQPKRISNGLRTLHDAIDGMADDAVVLATGWKTDFALVLDVIDERPGWDIVTAGHSFGCWAQNTKLFPALVERKRLVRECIWADPVCKEPLFGDITLSGCVQTLRTVVKKRRYSLIHASYITASPKVWRSDVRVNTNHAQVDETEEFQQAVLSAATKGIAT